MLKSVLSTQKGGGSFPAKVKQCGNAMAVNERILRKKTRVRPVKIGAAGGSRYVVKGNLE
jgi:hypothetical protein